MRAIPSIFQIFPSSLPFWGNHFSCIYFLLVSRSFHFPRNLFRLVQEAANVDWEAKSRIAAGGDLGGGLAEFLRAADAHGENAGVVDLMLR